MSNPNLEATGIRKSKFQIQQLSCNVDLVPLTPPLASIPPMASPCSWNRRWLPQPGLQVSQMPFLSLQPPCTLLHSVLATWPQNHHTHSLLGTSAFSFHPDPFTWNSSHDWFLLIAEVMAQMSPQKVIHLKWLPHLCLVEHPVSFRWSLLVTSIWVLVELS